MRRIIYVLSAACALTGAVSCEKANDGNPVSEVTTFTGAIENTDTKTTLTNQYKVNWENTDIVSINGSEFTATPDENDATRATFEGCTASSGSYTAIYPSSLYVTDHFELPATLSYTAGKFNNIPMWASSTTNTLSFKNIFAVLKISVPSSVMVTKVAVSSDLYLNGVFAVAEDIATMAEGSASNSTTTLDCGTSGVAGTDFYIPVPEGTYTGKNLKVTVTDVNNSTYSINTVQTVDINIQANNIYGLKLTITPAGSWPVLKYFDFNDDDEQL